MEELNLAIQQQKIVDRILLGCIDDEASKRLKFPPLKPYASIISKGDASKKIKKKNDSSKREDEQNKAPTQSLLELLLNLPKTLLPQEKVEPSVSSSHAIPHPKSNSQWQMDSFVLVRPIVVGLVDNAVGSSPGTQEVDLHSIKSKTSTYFQSEVGKEIEDEGALIFDEILDQIINLEVRNAFEKMEAFARASVGILSGIIFAATVKKEERSKMSDNLKTECLKSIEELLGNRRKKTTDGRKRTAMPLSICWHSRESHTSEGSDEDNSPGKILKVVDFNDLFPVEDFVRRSDGGLRLLGRAELDYWSNFQVVTRNPQVTERSSGVTSLRVSACGRFAAFAAKGGHICILDFNWIPSRLTMVHISRSGDEIIDLSWKKDSTHLTSLSEQGVLKIWSLGGGATGTHQPIKVEEHDTDLVIIKGKDGHLPDLIRNIFSLDARLGDFTFPLGRTSRRHGNVKTTSKPSLAAHLDKDSSFQISVAMDDRDVLICDVSGHVCCDVVGGDELEEDAKGRSRQDKVGKADVLRHHRRPVILLSTLKGELGDLVTMDTDGVVCTWKDDKKYSNDDGTLHPEQVLQVELNLSTFDAVSDDNLILFSEAKYSDKSELEKQRSSVEVVLRQSLESCLVWSSLDDGALVTSIFRPIECISSSGNLFHVVTRHKKVNWLHSYSVRNFRTIRLKSAKVMVSRVVHQRGQNFFAIMLLFPPVQVAGVCISLFVLNMERGCLLKFRKDFHFPTEVYEEMVTTDVMDCEMIDNCIPGGPLHVLTSIRGQLSAFSLDTGQEVFRLSERSPRLGGLEVVQDYPPNSKFTASRWAEFFLISLYASSLDLMRFQNPLLIVTAKDMNDRTNKGVMKAAYKETALSLSDPIVRHFWAI